MYSTAAALSSAETRHKENSFRQFYEGYAQIVCNVVDRDPARRYPEPWFIDLTAGSGVNRLPDGEVIAGSPLIWQQTHLALGHRASGCFIERDERDAEELQLRLIDGELTADGDRPLTCWTWVLAGDHETYAPRVAAAICRDMQRVHKTPYGLVYADPNHGRVPLAGFAPFVGDPLFARMDYLVYIAANGAYKRARGHAQHNGDGRLAHRAEVYLQDDLDALHKQYTWVRRPRTNQQWTFVLLSNYSGLHGPDARNWISSQRPEFGAVMRQLNLHKNEQAAELYASNLWDVEADDDA